MNRHVKLAIDSMKLEIKGLNINANLFEKYGALEPFCKNNSEKRAKLNVAIQNLVNLDSQLDTAIFLIKEMKEINDDQSEYGGGAWVNNDYESDPTDLEARIRKFLKEVQG